MNNPSPFSDTTSPPADLSLWHLADRLAQRIGVPHDSNHLRLAFTALHTVLDRLEALENAQVPTPPAA